LTELTVREQTHIKTVANDRRESQEEVLNRWLIIHKEDGYMVAGQVRDTWRSINPGVSPTSTATIIVSDFPVIKHRGCPANPKDHPGPRLPLQKRRAVL
jgi:hypothetical protein